MTDVITYALDTNLAVKALLTAQLPSKLTAVGISNTLFASQPDQLLIQEDEYQPQQSRYQIVLKEGNLKSVFLAPFTFRMEQGIMVEVHVRPVRYDPDTITAQRLIFENLKKAIQQIFDYYRYDSLFFDVDVNSCGWTDTTTYASIIEMKNWANSPIPHGYGKGKEPLEMVARMGITVIYYEADGSPVTNVGSRVVSISVIGNSLNGLVEAEWEDMDQWVQIKIPAGPVLEQNLVGTHIDGSITCRDWRSISNCFMQTAIGANAGHYPINSDGSKTKFSPTANEFSITIRDSSGQKVRTGSPTYYGTKLLVFLFTNVKIKQIKMVKSSTQGGVAEPQWQILFMADSFTQPTLN
jgi:hypothetical protein